MMACAALCASTRGRADPTSVRVRQVRAGALAERLAWHRALHAPLAHRTTARRSERGYLDLPDQYCAGGDRRYADYAGI